MVTAPRPDRIGSHHGRVLHVDLPVGERSVLPRTGVDDDHSTRGHRAAPCGSSASHALGEGAATRSRSPIATLGPGEDFVPPVDARKMRSLDDALSSGWYGHEGVPLADKRGESGRIFKKERL